VIVTVTPNPSIDRTLRIPPLVRGELHRALSATAEAGGKGINVSRALAAQGQATLAIVPLSEASAALIVGLLGGTTPLEAVPTAGEVRVNVSLVEADGTVTKVNEPGPPLRPEDVEALIDRTAELAARASWVVGCGSLPPGAPADLYSRLARRIPTPARMAIDADGAALRACVGEPVALLKPNRRELEELAGAPLATLGAVIGFGTELVGRGAGAVLVSLGRDGAVYVDAEGATHAEADIDDVLNPVGAGDALLAGFLAGGGDRTSLATAVAWSVAACRSPGTRMRAVTAADAATVAVRPAIESDRQLAA
jgi:1-phosphofructokinase family hexose kinase